MVVGLVFQNGKRPVQLLRKKQSDHLVGESHFGKGEFPVSTFFYRFAEAERATDDKKTTLVPRIHLLLYEFGKSFGIHFLAVFIQ